MTDQKPADQSQKKAGPPVAPAASTVTIPAETVEQQQWTVAQRREMAQKQAQAAPVEGEDANVTKAMKESREAQLASLYGTPDEQEPEGPYPIHSKEWWAWNSTYNAPVERTAKAV